MVTSSNLPRGRHIAVAYATQYKCIMNSRSYEFKNTHYWKLSLSHTHKHTHTSIFIQTQVSSSAIKTHIYFLTTMYSRSLVSGTTRRSVPVTCVYRTMVATVTTINTRLKLWRSNSSDSQSLGGKRPAVTCVKVLCSAEPAVMLSQHTVFDIKVYLWLSNKTFYITIT